MSPAGEFLPLSCSEGNISSFSPLTSCFNHFTAASEKGRPGIEIGSISFLFFESLFTCQKRKPEKFHSKEAALINDRVLCCLLVVTLNLCWAALLAVEFYSNPLALFVLQLKHLDSSIINISDDIYLFTNDRKASRKKPVWSIFFFLDRITVRPTFVIFLWSGYSKQTIYYGLLNLVLLEENKEPHCCYQK